MEVADTHDEIFRRQERITARITSRLNDKTGNKMVRITDYLLVDGIVVPFTCLIGMKMRQLSKRNTPVPWKVHFATYLANAPFPRPT